MNTALATTDESLDVGTFFDNAVDHAHVVHLYERDDVFLDTLEGFVNGGLRAGEVVVLIATAAHLFAMDHRLQMMGWELAGLHRSGQYLPLDAAQALAGFMRDGHPDAALFNDTIVAMIDHAQAGGRRVRAFGEMVALLWANGDRDATRELEELWNTVCRDKQLSLLCAYPRQQPHADEGLQEMCALHSHVLAA